MTPGLTCIWQVRGRSQVSFADWVRMDVQYIRSRSLSQDLKLLLLTMPAVVAGKERHIKQFVEPATPAARPTC